MRRLAAALAALLVVGVLATGCSGDDASADDADGGPALSSEAATAALLTVADLPEGFTETDAATAEADGAQPGCLSALNDLDGVDVETRVRSVFTEGGAGVLSTVASDTDTALLRSSLDDLRDALADCDTVTADESADYELKLTVTTDDVAADDAVDDQLNVATSGTLRAAGGEPVSYQASFSLVLVGSALTTVGAFQVGEAATGVIGRLGPLTETVVGRLLDQE